MTKYSLTDEHRAQLAGWAERWIQNALSTAPMTEHDRLVCVDAVERLYRAANLTPPPRHRIVFVPSPFVARFAGGFAAWIWHRRTVTHNSTYAATREATHEATRDATREATYNATDEATYEATREAMREATRAATYKATRDATDDATRDATDDATYKATREATDLNKWYFTNGDLRQCAEDLGLGTAGLQCAELSYRMWQGGNQWSAFDSFLSFFRHVAKLDLDYSGWDAWETLSLHSGPRVVHQEFCIISDRPEVLDLDDQSRPHCEEGPFCRWRDGSALYAVHGVRVPGWIIEFPERITCADVRDEPNAEVRRVMIERMGWPRYLRESQARVLQRRTNAIEATEEALLESPDGRVLVCACPSTAKVFALPVPAEIATCEAAQNWLSGGLSRRIISAS